MISKQKEISGLLGSCNIDDISLLSGLSGINIAIYNLKSKNYKSNIIKNTEKILFEINNGFSVHTHCLGISGFLWSLKYFIGKGMLNAEENDITGEFNSFLYKRMKEDMENNNLDFLHGAIGLGLFFLNDSSNKNSLNYVKELIDKIEELSIIDSKGGLKWRSVVFIDRTPKEVYNLGLSHGISSIIAFLTKTYSCGVSKSKSKRLLKGAIKYLLSNKNDIEKNNCYFPSWISDDEENRSSRLSWCYGDLGIAVTLYNASEVLKNVELKKFSLKVLYQSALRRDLENEFVLDAGLCHGTSGIAHIFYRMYWNTKDEVFKEAASFWFKKTLEMSKFSDGLAGYKVFRSEEHGGYINDYGILEGIAGIGLAINSWISQTEPQWDECILLS